MVTRRDHQKGDYGKVFVCERVGDDRKRTNNSDTASTIKNRLNRGTKCFHVYTESDTRIFLAKFFCDFGNRIDGIEDVNDY